MMNKERFELRTRRANKVRTRAILATMLVFIALCGVLFGYGVMVYNNRLADYMDVFDRQIHEVLDYEKASLDSQYLARLRGFARINKKILAALAAGDREKLYQAALPRFKTLQGENPFFDGMVFVSPDEKMLLRVHMPDKYGDVVSDVPYFKEFRAGAEVVSGIHVAKMGPAYRVFIRATLEGRHVGYIGFIVSFDHITAALKRLGDVFNFFVLDPSYNSLVSIKGYSFIEHNGRLVFGLDRAMFRQLDNLDFNTQDQLVKLKGERRTLQLHIEQIKAYGGEELGAMVICQDVTGEVDRFHEFVSWLVLLIIIVLGLAFLILYPSFGHMLMEINKLTWRLEEEVAEQTRELMVVNKRLEQEVDEHSQARVELASSLAAKEILLREVHHRVKNNMQVVASLLAKEEDRAEDRQVAQVFRDSRSRIMSMAQIHEKLYLAEDHGRVNCETYVTDLVKSLVKTHDFDRGQLDLNLEVADIRMGLDTAVPLGLVINELVTNALEHAFVPDKPGSLWVSLIRQDSDIVLTVADNGRGLDQYFNFRSAASLGFYLIINLVERQLDGKIELDRDKGTMFTIRFAEPFYSERL